MQTKRKLFNSKNIVFLIESLIKNNKADLAREIINLEFLQPHLPNILSTLKRKNIKLENYEQTQIFSKTELADDLLEEIKSSLNIKSDSVKIIIDENMSAGVKVKSRDRLIDASMTSMLEAGLKELINHKK